MSMGRLVQLAPWVLVLAMVLFGGHVERFAAPWLTPILWAGWGLLVVLILLSIPRIRADHPQVFGWGELVVHAVPLWIFVTVGPSDLGAWSLGRNRMYVPETVAAVANPDAMDDTEWKPAPEQSVHIQPKGSNGDGPIDPQADQPIKSNPTLIELYQPPYATAGTKVTVMGYFFRRAGSHRSDLPPEIRDDPAEWYLFRYAITCCAADARPVLVALSGVDDATAPRSERWVQVSGTLTPHSLERPVPEIAVEALEAVEAVKDPYLYLDPW